jgi:hypothetical protein
MGFFRRRGPDRERPPSNSRRPLDSALTDDEWWVASASAFAETVHAYYGSPESMAQGGKNRYRDADFGVAAFFYHKSIDMLHTAYGFSNMEHREPSPADAPIVDGFCNSLSASIEGHPNAPIDEVVREVTHRLRSIATTCDRVGAPSQLYRGALEKIAQYTPNVQVDDILWT